MMRKFLMLFIALCLHSAARGQTWTYEYWFDNDRSTLQTGTSDSGTFTINADVSGLSENLHAVSIQVTGNGVSSYSLQEVAVEGQTYNNVVVNRTVTSMLSAPLTRYFVKVPTGTPTVRWWIDDEAATQSVTTGTTVSLDMNAVKEGFHMLHVQPEGTGGAWGTPRTYPFLKVLPAPASLSGDDLMKCYYALDGGSFSNEAGTLANGVYQFNIDVTALTDGLHKISFVLSNARGITTNAQTHFFIKIPVGGYGITSYWYWLNEDDEHIVTVPVNPRQNPFTLNTTLLQLAEMPIRSTKFAFGFKDGQAAIFAKNDLHVRFFDVSGRFTDYNATYVDERVYYLLDNNILAALLMNVNETSSTDLSAENSVQWYSLELVKDNVLRLKVDNPATIQVFDQSGHEVYTAQGAESTQWGEVTAASAGTYYAVVHDPTGNNKSVKLQYDIISLKGDANGDNDVTIDDAVTIVQHILGSLGTGTFVEKAADYNGDGRVSIADVVAIVKAAISSAGH